jgi:hypothetical protein
MVNGLEFGSHMLTLTNLEEGKHLGIGYAKFPADQVKWVFRLVIACLVINSPHSQPSGRRALIGGTVVGVIAALMLLALLAWYLRKRRLNRGPANSNWLHKPNKTNCARGKKVIEPFMDLPRNADSDFPNDSKSEWSAHTGDETCKTKGSDAVPGPEMSSLKPGLVEQGLGATPSYFSTHSRQVCFRDWAGPCV